MVQVINGKEYNTAKSVLVCSCYVGGLFEKYVSLYVTSDKEIFGLFRMVGGTEKYLSVVQQERAYRMIEQSFGAREANRLRDMYFPVNNN